MNRTFFRSAAVMASIASLSLVATPALARDRWGGWGGRYHHDRVDAGDVLAGVLIIGGIAAVASAAAKAARERRDNDRRYDDRRYDNRDYEDRGTSGREYRGEDYRAAPDRGDAPGTDYDVAPARNNDGMSQAVDRCVGEIERGSTRVESVDETRREGNGWKVEGQVSGNEEFACTIDGDGRIRDVTIGGRAL
ncbi:hypothetical protein B0I00_1037 [Novosphingobium kunmingense]|uniref:YpeB-like protein with protease inhibitory function n=1 Tax=Novosphingobium kunmingense TaxID=1211806 RepID=A0A2N0I3S9_9SPHN|nr:hypothetical protein [Novosphingobium kunmingense]PKB25830.1 hypothetical protein B0I00_1037 [Novosphingobium kunmingense]